MSAKDPRIARTTALVEATSHEMLALWNQHAKDGMLDYREPRMRSTRLEWVEDNKGWWQQIGKCAGKPVVVAVFFATIGGHVVCFYEATSRVVDHEMVEKWLRKTFPKDVRKTNAMNFHNAFDRWPA